MDDQDRVSQASSVATISYFPVMQESDGKVQTFGKRCHAAKRDPNCPVIIRGWLNKKDSSGLKLWKRRWFVLSNYCLYYYKDSREESVLGSIPLPSYKILFCTPRECKNRKFTFKVVHQGMRAYFFSADTQEDMLGWVRALSQSAAMEPDNTLNRRCSSYQDFTQIGGSSESMDFPKSPSEEESSSQKRKHVSRTLSEPSHLSSGRMGRSLSEQRGRRTAHHRNRSPSNRTPSPPDSSRRRSAGQNKEDDSLHGENIPTLAEAGSVTFRGQMGSRPHTPVGRVDIRPHDDPIMMPQTLYYTPASPKLEFKSAPTTPVTERWQSLSKPVPIYGSVHTSSGRKPLGKSLSTGADLLPPIPPSSRATHAPHLPQHHHHHCSHLSVCALPPAMASKPDPRELPPIRPLESDADAVLTRLCGCDKLLQSLSVELAQLQMDKDSVQCALEVSRLQVEEWKSQGPRAHEEALTQKALLQEDLVTIRARMCDISLVCNRITAKAHTLEEMERVWSQYERMESELTVIRSHLQHICNFGMPQEQSQAQRELWMMEDILDGLKVNRDHFCFLLGLQRHHLFQSPAPHPGSPGSPTERLQMDMEQEPPARPPLPMELQENHQGWDQGHGWKESPYEGIYSHAVEPVHRRGNSQPDLLNVKAQRASESQSASKSIPPDTATQPNKKMKVKMSEEEQIERMKKNQERITNKKKPPIPAHGAQSQSSEPREEAPFPLRVTRVVTAVLPSSLVARRVSVEDPPAELNTPLPEQIPPEMQLKLTEQSMKLLNKPPSSDEMHQGPPVKRTSRQQYQEGCRASKTEAHLQEAEASCNQDHTGSQSGRDSLDVRQEEEQAPAPLTPGTGNDSNLSPDQRDAKLRRVERIRERVMRSAAREKVTAVNRHPIRRQEKEAHQVPLDTVKKCLESSKDNVSSSAGLQISSPTFPDEEHRRVNESKSQAKFEYRTQHSGRARVAKTKINLPTPPSHFSSMTVYQKEGGEGFIGYNNEEMKPKEHTDDDENNFKSCELRAKWFLSTNQWQGFIPLQISAFETLSNEEKEEVDTPPPHSHRITEFHEMSSTVSESLEKMKENHSLFYKIACDISISDSDISRNDVQTSSKPEEEEMLITESLAASNDVIPSEQDSEGSSQTVPSEENDEAANKNIQHSTNHNPSNVTLTISAKTACAYGKMTPQQSENNSGQEGQLTIVKSCVQDRGSDQDLDDHAKTKKKHSPIKRSEDKKKGRERLEDLNKCTSLSKENNENKQEQNTRHSISLSSSVQEGGGVIRSASFGKPRVTVLRTSL